MIKTVIYKRLFGIVCLLIMGILLFTTSSFSDSAIKTGKLKISFLNTVNGKPVVLRDSLYFNYFGEQYSISKLRYYISNISVDNKHLGGYYLVNAASEDNSFELELQPGNYQGLGFLLGVDSIRNCSGAQTDALDPMNDMFWTWNSGYVMFKLEGTSPSSASDLNRIEHHIGGYKGLNNVATHIGFSKENFEIKAGQETEIVIEMNLDNYWHGNTNIKIVEISVCMTPGELSKKLSGNFRNMFSIKNIRLNP